MKDVYFYKQKLTRNRYADAYLYKMFNTINNPGDNFELYKNIKKSTWLLKEDNCIIQFKNNNLLGEYLVIKYKQALEEEMKEYRDKMLKKAIYGSYKNGIVAYYVK